jgi:hypothetical protein
MASPAARNLIVVIGVLLLLVQAALLVCWWKLPDWAPQWVIANSPWPEPALRAACRHPAMASGLHDRLLDFGPAIGPALLQQYTRGDTDARKVVLVLAAHLARMEGVAPGAQPPPSGSIRADVAILREDLVELARMAFAEGSLDLGETAAFLAAPLRDRRLTLPMCRLVAGQPTPIAPEVANLVTALGVMGDPQAVPTLISLLPIRHRTHPEVEQALDRCQDGTTFPQILMAIRHVHPVVRTWAANQLQRYLPVRPAHPATAVSTALRQALAGAVLFEATQQEGDLFAQLAQLQALGGIRFRSGGPYLRSLVAHPDPRIRGAAIIALGDLGDVGDFPLLLELLRNDDEDIARKARIALGRLSLTQEQQRQVSARWDALEDDPEPTPIPPASPSAR